MKKNNTFEEALFELQSIITKLESGSPALQEMIDLFEEGIGLMDYCKKELNQVEDRVKILEKNLKDLDN